MASANSLRSLMRPSIPVAPRLYPIISSSFSTTTALSAVTGRAPKSSVVTSTKMKKSFKKGGGSASAPMKKPNPGERKAFRKRIQLSNNSALAVEGIEVLGADTLAQSSSAGKMFSIPDEIIDQLRTLEAFKATQAWNLFRKPHFLARKEAVELASRLENAATKKEAEKIVLTGSKLSGKSLAVLQAISYALLNKWVVINIPEAQDLTNGNTDYAHIPNTEPAVYSQPVYIFRLLQTIHKANKAVLESLKVEKDWPLTGLQKGNSLAELILTCKESEFAWTTFNALWTELTLPGRPPVLFSLDGLSHISKLSQYRDPAFNLIHSHDLALIRTFVDALSGKTKLPNGGAVIASTSGNNMQFHPSQELVLAQLEAGQSGNPIPKPDPYEKNYDERVYESLKNVSVLRIEGINHDDTKTLMGYWAASGLLRNIVNNHTIREKWALAGNGNVGEMERVALLTMRM
ncbi:unnamed protein product [Clonostachys solani]|uniref:Small ribosomal subunit protein mS29 n=1 Tax=Clonostachys solani TaxID=160281 RepID=A0A9P0EHG2_9HYPO|nr:unnamed protein product [Clonostachys solani]